MADRRRRCPGPRTLRPRHDPRLGDVDRDGDPDLLLGIGTRSDLLRNDHGTFVRLPAVGPRGMLVDVDADLDADLFDGARIHHDRHCQLGAPLLPSLGASYRLEVHTYRTGPMPSFAWLAVAPFAGYLVTPAASIIRVNPTQALVAPVALANGAGSLTLPIPPTLPLLGTSLVLQALVLDPATSSVQGSNALHETIR